MEEYIKIKKDNYDKLKEDYGYCASWAVWKMPDANGGARSNIDDLSVFDYDDICDKLNTRYVFVGLNAANHGQGKEENNWQSFHSAYRYGRDFMLRDALYDTCFWGSYITDIIKGYQETKSQKVMSAYRKRIIDIQEHINAFEKELALLEIENPILVAMGNAAFEILNDQFKEKYNICKIRHYSCPVKKDTYRSEVSSTIEKYIKDNNL